MSQDEKHLAMRTLFTREYRVRKLKIMGAPPRIMENEEALASKARTRMLETGATEDEYKQFCDAYWFYYETKAVEADMNLGCLERMRQYQAVQKKNLGLVPDDFNCRYDKGECGPFCVHYSKADGEQEKNFHHLCDIDTGERFPIDALEKDINEASGSE